jgi:nucleotide-binding universal stress UspA family protein
MAYPYKIILCPVDFDESSMFALGHARRIAADMGAQVHLLHALPILPMLADHGTPVPIDEAADREAARRLKEIARTRLARIPTEIHTRIVFQSEVPKTILAFARELGADLVVMATHGRSTIPHMFFGSVTEAVVRNAVCPVLTMRPAPETAKAAASGRSASAKSKTGAARR